MLGVIHCGRLQLLGVAAEVHNDLQADDRKRQGNSRHNLILSLTHICCVHAMQGVVVHRATVQADNCRATNDSDVVRILLWHIQFCPGGGEGRARHALVQQVLWVGHTPEARHQQTVDQRLLELT